MPVAPFPCSSGIVATSSRYQCFLPLIIRSCLLTKFQEKWFASLTSAPVGQEGRFVSIDAEGEFHLQYERIFSGVAKDRLTIQRKFACVSLILMSIEACYYSLAWKVEGGK